MVQIDREPFCYCHHDWIVGLPAVMGDLDLHAGLRTLPQQ